MDISYSGRILPRTRFASVTASGPPKKIKMTLNCFQIGHRCDKSLWWQSVIETHLSCNKQALDGHWLTQVQQQTALP